MTTVLTLCQRVVNRMGLKALTTVTGAQSEQRQLLALANETGDEIARYHTWEYLVKEGSVTLATSDQDYALPTDFDRLIFNTMWNRSDSRPVVIPTTGQEWQLYEAWSVDNGLNLRGRIKGGELVFQQTIDASRNGQSVYFEYRSTNWAEDSGGTGKAQFTADDDVTLHNDDLHAKGIKWRYKKEKGLPDWQADMEDYYTSLRSEMAGDGSARRLYLGDYGRRWFGANVPDGNFGI